MSGVLTVSAPASRPTSGTVEPAAAQVRNPTRNSTAKIVVSQSGTFWALRTRRKAYTAIAAISTTVTMPVASAGSTIDGSTIASSSLLRR